MASRLVGANGGLIWRRIYTSVGINELVSKWRLVYVHFINILILIMHM